MNNPKCALFSFSLALLTGAALSSSVPNGVLELPLIRIQNQTQYGAEFQVGEPPQRNVVIADTGSAEAPGFMNKSSTACQESRCDEYGTYDNLTSSTAIFVSNGYGAAVGPDPYGAYINDTIRFGGNEFLNFTFGKEDAFTRPRFPFEGPQAGFLGLSNYCNVSVSPTVCQEVDNLLEQLHTRNAIDRRFFSVYLGPSEPNATGKILFGGVDRAKQATKPFAVPMSLEANAGYQANFVNMTAVTLRLQASNNSVATTSNAVDGPVLVDSGTHDLSLDRDMAQSILDFWNVKSALGDGVVEVDCQYRNADPTNALVLSFNGGSNNVSVPLSTLITEYGPGQCGADIAGYGFGIIAAPLLRGLYVSFDLDMLEITFSEASHTTAEDVLKV